MQKSFFFRRQSVTSPSQLERLRFGGERRAVRKAVHHFVMSFWIQCQFPSFIEAVVGGGGCQGKWGIGAERKGNHLEEVWAERGTIKRKLGLKREAIWRKLGLKGKRFGGIEF